MFGSTFEMTQRVRFKANQVVLRFRFDIKYAQKRRLAQIGSGKCNQLCKTNARIQTMHSHTECVQAFLPKNSLCCGVIHQVKKLLFDVLCFLREVVNSEAGGIPRELNR